MTNSWLEPPSRPALETALPSVLKQLKLPQFRSQWQAAEQQATADGWSPASYLYVLAEQEHQHLERPQIEQLAHDTGWLDRAENLLLFGPSGVGKTHLAAGICRSLIALDRTARFFSATTLVQELQRAKADYALAKALNRLDRYALLVIDDNRFAEAKGYGYVRKDEAETSVLFELVMHRYERKSLLVTSNQPFSEWENVFSTSAMTVAAVDRLVDHSTIIQINGESYRRKRARRLGRPSSG
jgi:DNA replication protein DnaC